MGYDAYATVVYGVKTDYIHERRDVRLCKHEETQYRHCPECGKRTRGQEVVRIADWLDEKGYGDLEYYSNHCEDDAVAYVGEEMVKIATGDEGELMDYSFHNMPEGVELTKKLKELFPDKVIGYWVFLQESY